MSLCHCSTVQKIFTALPSLCHCPIPSKTCVTVLLSRAILLSYPLCVTVLYRLEHVSLFYCLEHFHCSTISVSLSYTVRTCVTILLLKTLRDPGSTQTHQKKKRVLINKQRKITISVHRRPEALQRKVKAVYSCSLVNDDDSGVGAMQYLHTNSKHFLFTEKVLRSLRAKSLSLHCCLEYMSLS